MSYYGKYRATVVNNIDPLQLGRLQVQVAEALRFPTAWALPCLPPGPLHALPNIGASVWVEFERGDIENPIWCGVFWPDATQLPDSLRPGQPDDALVLRARTGANIRLDSSGIVIDNGQGASVVLKGPSVSINAGALDIT